jgi:predicted CXXCH cytochrome family protein
MSRDCISCHDGSVGSSVMLKAGNWRHSKDFLKFDQGGKHPIGMNYEKVRMSNRKNMLRPIEMVDKRIRFFNNGCVGCGSCHDPFSVKNKKLIIENNGSALCFSCHNS